MANPISSQFSRILTLAANTPLVIDIPNSVQLIQFLPDSDIYFRFGNGTPAVPMSSANLLPTASATTTENQFQASTLANSATALLMYALPQGNNIQVAIISATAISLKINGFGFMDF